MPSAPPSASEPTSPMKMSAGYELYQRNPRLAPTSAPQKIVSSPISGDTVWQLQVLGEHAMAADVGQRGERGGRDAEHADRQPVEAVGEVDRVGPGDADERREQDVDPAEIGNAAA